MKRIFLIGLPLIVIAALSGALWKTNRTSREMERRFTATKAAEDSLRTRFDAALTSIAEIQDSLAAVLPGESSVLQMSRDVERSGTLTSSRKSEVLRNISDLNASIQRSKEMIARLEQRLDESETKITSLERVISNLKKTVAEREEMIAGLRQRVESLNVQVAGLQTEVATGQHRIEAQQRMIEDKQKEISTIHYVVATRRKLKELGIVEESGGVLGLGRTSKLSGQFPVQFFQRVDTDLQTTIPVPGRDPVVLSGQAAGSYYLVPDGAGSHELRITRADEFRKVRYLVIQVR